MTIEQRLRDVKSCMAKAARQAEGAVCKTTLIAVSKTRSEDEIIAAIDAGQTVFGENRVQEALQKWPGLKTDYPDIELHLIGPLQSNKTKEAVGLFDVIQTIDRPKIAGAIAREIAAQNKQPRLMVQVNTGEEPQKAGVLPQDLPGFLALCRQTHGLIIDGLMCIPPVAEEPALHFALLKKCGQENNIAQLSMGMSADFETAVQFGADYVRVGTAVFGGRSLSL